MGREVEGERKGEAKRVLVRREDKAFTCGVRVEEGGLLRYEPPEVTDS